MSVTASGDVRLALNYLREMFADSQTWRAIVAQPLYSWPDLATLIAAATSSEANARNAVREGSWQNQSDHADYRAAPVVSLKQAGMRWNRQSTSGFHIEGSIEAMLVMPVPTAYRDTKNRFTEDGYQDFYNKIGNIAADIRALGRASGYLDVTGLEFGEDHGFSHPKDDVANVFVGFLNFEWAGGSA